MRTFSSLLVLALLAAGCAQGGPAMTPPRDVPTGTVASSSSASAKQFDAALAEARQTGRNVIVEYASDSCGWCAKMDREVFPLPKVKAALRDVVFVRVRADDAPKAFVSRWGRPGTPSFVALDPNGREVGKMVSGAMSPSAFLSYVSWARTGEGSVPAVSSSST